MMRPMNVFQDGFFGDLFDDVFRDFGETRPAKPVAMRPGLLKTDVLDQGDKYALEIEMPGYKKDDVTAELKDGYLVITANKNEEKEDKPEDGRYIRKERYTGYVSRSFFVGKKLKEEDITASFADGILKLNVPKENAIEREEEKKMIPIL